MLPVPMNPGVTVVVVEGDAETLGYMSYRLREYFTVVEAGFAEAVSAAVGETDASLVVIGSPAQADAYALAVRLRRERGRRTRTVELTGETPAAHLRRARMEHVARRLAETDLTVDEIRIEAGFANQTHFYNTFRKYFGVSPAQYRGGERAEPNSTRSVVEGRRRLAKC